MSKWKEDQDRGDFGAWLTAQVGERTYDWLADEMAKKGHVHGAAYYRAMAGGSKPGGRVIRRALREFFGAGPDVGASAPAPSSDQSVLAEAIRAQNELLLRQVKAIERNAEATEGLVKALGARMDRLEQDRQRDFRNLVEGISDTMIHAFQVALAGAKDGSGSDESTHGVHQGSGQ